MVFIIFAPPPEWRAVIRALSCASVSSAGMPRPPIVPAGTQGARALRCCTKSRGTCHTDKTRSRHFTLHTASDLKPYSRYRQIYFSTGLRDFSGGQLNYPLFFGVAARSRALHQPPYRSPLQPDRGSVPRRPQRWPACLGGSHVAVQQVRHEIGPDRPRSPSAPPPPEQPRALWHAEDSRKESGIAAGAERKREGGGGEAGRGEGKSGPRTGEAAREAGESPRVGRGEERERGREGGRGRGRETGRSREAGSGVGRGMK